MINPIAASFLTASVQKSIRNNYNYDDVLLKSVQQMPKNSEEFRSRRIDDICKIDQTEMSQKCIRILSGNKRQKSWKFWRKLRASL